MGAGVGMGNDQGAPECPQGEVEVAPPPHGRRAFQVGHRAVPPGFEPLPEVRHVQTLVPGDDSDHLEAEGAGSRDGTVAVQGPDVVHADILPARHPESLI